MDNLYKRKFPKRSRHETVVDLLRLNDSQFKQFQDVAGQYMGGALVHKKIRRPRNKLLPRTLRTLRNVDSPQTLAALIGIPYSYVSPLAYIRTNIEGTYNVLEASKN